MYRRLMEKGQKGKEFKQSKSPVITSLTKNVTYKPCKEHCGTFCRNYLLLFCYSFVHYFCLIGSISSVPSSWFCYHDMGPKIIIFRNLSTLMTFRLWAERPSIKKLWDLPAFSGLIPEGPSILGI